jgi:hypothetical protein
MMEQRRGDCPEEEDGDVGEVIEEFSCNGAFLFNGGIFCCEQNHACQLILSGNSHGGRIGLTWSVAAMFAAWKLYLSAVVSPTTPLVSLNLAGKFSCMRMILSRTTDCGGAL